MSYRIEIDVAAPGSVETPGRTLTLAQFDAFRTRLEAQAVAAGGALIYSLHREASADAEFAVEVPTWNRSAVLNLARQIFTATSWRGSIRAFLDETPGHPFFTLSMTDAAVDPVKWDEATPIPQSRNRGQEGRP